MQGRILIVEDESFLRESLCEFFVQENYSVSDSATLEQAREKLASTSFDLMILDLKLPDGSGLDLLNELMDQQSPQVIVTTAFPEVQSAVKALKLGAYDYINKPFDLDELQLVVDRALDARQLENVVDSYHQREKQRHHRSWTRLEGESDALRQIRQQIMLVANSDATTTLILGESGVGKELVAEAIHFQSSRNRGPLLKVNCAALPASLLEDELFGHEKWAFTDARKERKGLFELADNGTLFLDEIAEMEIGLQAKLLRVLEDRTISRIGGREPVHVNVRIVTATNRNLLTRIRAGQFREDLYYRLNVFPLRVPPLREHPEDIPVLANLFLTEFLLRTPDKECCFSAEALKCLQQQHWPGNVRELKNIIERISLLHSGGMITPADLNPLGCCNDSSSLSDEETCEPLFEVEKRHIIKVYQKNDYNKTKTADLLGITRLTLRRKLNEYGVD